MADRAVILVHDLFSSLHSALHGACHGLADDACAERLANLAAASVRALALARETVYTSKYIPFLKEPQMINHANLHHLTRHSYRLSISITLIALCIRIVFVTVYTPRSPLAGGDQDAYWSFAEGILAGNGFRATLEPWLADRPPAYPYFLAAVFAIFGKNKSTVLVVQALLGSVACFLFCLSVMRIGGIIRGAWAGLLFAFLPAFLIFLNQILAESLYIFLIITFLFSLICLDKVPIIQWILTGILLGLIALTRREGLFFGVVIVAPYVFQVMKTKQFHRAVLGLFSLLLVVMPWLIRNYEIFGVPLLSTSTGVNFLVGNNPESTGGYALPDAWARELGSRTELERDQRAWELSLGWIRENPSAWLSLLPRKVLLLYGPSGNLLSDIADLFIVTFTLIGLWKLVKSREKPIIVLWASSVLALGTTLGAIVFVGGWRYRALVYVGALMLSAYAIDAVYRSRMQAPTSSA
jgi:hypothetical protein